jgi:hypothetical protein
MTGRLAAPASSKRRTGVVYGALRAISGSSAASRRISAIASAKASERLLGLRLGRLDEQRLVDEQREIDGGRMKAEVQQPLGQVERLEAELALHRGAREHELVHASRS